LNWKQKTKWFLVVIGSAQSEAESARDSQSLLICLFYLCVLQHGIFDDQKLQQLRDTLEGVSKRL